MKQTGTETDINTSMTLPEPKLAKSWLVRCVCIALAGLCLILGTIGLVVPGFPTFDFYFLAAIFAAKGSKRMHHWIVNNRLIAPITAVADPAHITYKSEVIFFVEYECSSWNFNFDSASSVGSRCNYYDDDLRTIMDVA